MKSQPRYPVINLMCSAVLVFLFIQGAVPARVQAQKEPAPSLDEQQIIQKAKDEVMKELRESDFLKEQIQLGIQDYIKKQREAQAAAQAEQARLAREKAQHVRRVSATRDHIMGNPDALLSLIEYSDYECPFCKRFHETAKEIMKAYDGKIN